MAAILKIVISPYLSHESSEFVEIWYADTNFDADDGNMTKIQKFIMPDRHHNENHFLAVTQLHIV